MIEIQLEIDGPWIPLIHARGSFDLTINEGERILKAGLTGVRVLFDSGEEAMVVRRYAVNATQFLWRSSQMASPAFAHWR